MSDEFDELASAYLDGEASEEEARRVEHDPVLLRLAEELRQLQVGAEALPPVAIDPVLKTRHLAAAMDAFQPIALDSGASDSGMTVIDLRSRQRRRMQWLSAAAAGVVVIAGVGIALNTRSNDAVESLDAAGVEVESESDGGVALKAMDDTTRAGEMAVEANSVASDSAASDSAASDSAATEDALAASATAPGAPSPLVFGEMPTAAEALAKASAQGLLPPAGSAAPEVEAVCATSLGLSGTIVAVIPIEGLPEALSLYVVEPEATTEPSALLVDGQCEVRGTD